MSLKSKLSLSAVVATALVLLPALAFAQGAQEAASNKYDSNSWLAVAAGFAIGIGQALFGFAARPELFTPFVTDAREFPRLQQAAAGLDYHAQEPNFTLALATLAGRLARRSLIVVFSDFTDPTSAELMIESVGRLVSRHLVLFVTMADEELVDGGADLVEALHRRLRAVLRVDRRGAHELLAHHHGGDVEPAHACLLYTSPSPRD